MTTIQEDLADVVLLLKAFVERHGTHNQKTHGNRFGGYSTTKESLRRLKDDKAARERYKATARKRKVGKTKTFPKANISDSEWKEWGDISESLGTEFGIRKGKRSKVWATIRTKSKNEKPSEFQDKKYYLLFQTPRGGAGYKYIKMIQKLGKHHYSNDMDKLIKLADKAINDSEKI